MVSSKTVEYLPYSLFIYKVGSYFESERRLIIGRFVTIAWLMARRKTEGLFEGHSEFDQSHFIRQLNHRSRRLSHVQIIR